MSKSSMNVFYQSAAQQFVSRVQMRDNISLFFLAATGTIFGISFGRQTVDTESLLVIPYLAVACTPLIIHHNVMLGSLLSYLKIEIPSNLQSDIAIILPFEASRSLESHFNLALNLRTIGQLAILLLPSIFSLVVNWHKAINGDIEIIIAYWFAVICTLCTMFLVLIIHSSQKHLVDPFNGIPPKS